MSVVDAISTAEINVEGIPALAQYITSGHSQGELIQVSADVGTPVIQVQDGGATAGTYVQVSEGSLAPIVQFADQSQGVYITEGFPHGIQFLDGSIPLVQGSDGTSIIQLPQMVSGAGLEGLTQVVQFAGGQIALIEQQENIDPQNVQFVLEQVPVQTATQLEGEIQQQQQQLMDTAAPVPKTELPSALADDVTKPPIGKGPFTCDICEKKLEKWNQYLRHLKTHDDDKPFRCFNCPATFNIADNLKLHLATHVEPGAKPVCPDCGKKFTRVASLKAHIMMHEKEESLMCTECGDEFSTQSHLDRHMLEHKEDREGTRVFSCKQCNAQFHSRPELKEHTKQHFKIKTSLSHRNYKREIDRTSFSHKCQHCMKSFQKPSQLQRHVRVHTGDRPFKCEVCNKAFNQKGALQMHILGKHTDKKPHKCQFCPAGFSQRGNLRAHIQRVHTLADDTDPGKTVFSCSECSCMFRKLGSLNAHISRFHTELDPEASKSLAKKKRIIGEDNDQAVDVIQQLLELSEAGATPGMVHNGSDNSQQLNLPRDDILQQALQNSGVPGTTDKEGEPGKSDIGGTLSVMNIRDTATGAIKKHYVRKMGNVTWHQCTFCTKEFKKPSDLVRHTRIHSHEKPYKCTQCFRAFAVKSTLNSHIRTHLGIKQFKCNVCEKNFSTHGSLKVHLRLHTGAKPFNCQHCDMKFRTPAHQKTHMLGHFKNLEKGPVRMKTDPAYKKLSKDINLPDIPMQEPILITDTGFIQQPPRNTLFNQYLGESGSVDRPYKCPHCQRGFKKSSHLKQHIRSHTGEKPYKCLTCGRTFVSNGVLKAHIRIHTGSKQYKCIMCDNMFSTNGSLKRHMSTHSDVRPFMCPYCQRVFKTSVNCKKHMKTHRHELAMQSVASNNPIQNVAQGETVISQATGEYVEEEAVENDLTLVQQDLNSAGTITNTDLGQQTILQTGLHDLGLTTTNLDQQILNQQMYGGQQQTFTQSLLGSGQQNFQQVNAQLAMGQQPQYIQQQGQLNQMELGYQQTQQSIQELQASTEHIPETQTVHHIPISQTLDNTVNDVQNNTLISTSLPNTSIPDILQTSGVVEETELDTVVEEEEEVEDDDDGPTASQDDEAQDPSYPGDGRNFPCELCDKAYKKSSHLKQHMRSHTGEKPYRCTQCGKTFVSMGVLRGHLRTHTGVKEYKCSVCHALFTTNGSLTRHMNIHVSMKPYKCPFCLEGFRTAWACKKHMTEHSNEDGGGVEQQQEEERPKKAPARLVNVDQVIPRHTVPDMNVSEKILVESASERDRISEVKEMGEGGSKHAHQCAHCAKSFKKPSDLVRHIRIHTGEKPFACGVCSRTFTVKSTLDSHMKTHGGMEKTIRCHICGSMFSTKGSLKVHMRLHTGAKPFKCPHCPGRFRTSGHRKSHILQHYKPETSLLRRKRNVIQTINVQEVQPPSEPMDFINQVQPTQQETQQQQQQQTIIQGQGQVPMGQVINIDQSMLPSNMMPLSLTVDSFGNLTDGSVGTHILQGLDGIQLQLAGGNLAQGIQITGLDPNSVGQAFQIDASVLQQLQSGNLNITLNPNQLQVADPNMVQNIGNLQMQPINIQEGVNPNLVIQPLGGIGVDQTTVQMASQSSQMNMNPDMTQGTFVMANNGMMVDQQVLQPTNVTEVQTDNITTQTLVSNHGNLVQHQDNTTVGNNNDIVIDTEMTQLNQDIDQDASGMTSGITSMDPNMTNANMDDLSGALIGGDNPGNNSDNDDVDDIDDDDDDDDDLDTGDNELDNDLNGSDVVQDTVGDDINEDHLHDPRIHDQLMKAQIAGGIRIQQQVQAANLKSGDIVMEVIGANKNHECLVCKKTFRRASNLKEHMQVHMKQTAGDKKAGTHTCQYCNKTFQKPSQMERHLRIHTGERPFQCGVCSKAFNQKNALQMHLKKHSGDKPHQCPYCTNAFVQKGNLKTHIKRTHHSEMVSSMNMKGDKPDEQVDGADNSSSQVVNQDINLSEVADLF